MDKMEGGGFFSLIITKVINSDAIYASMTALSGASFLILWMIAIFFGFRVFQEGMKSLSAKAAVAEAAMSMNKTVLAYLLYSTAGLVLFGFIFSVNELFQFFGSINYINDGLIDFRADLIHKEAAYNDFVEGLLSYTADIGNVVTTPFIWVLYQLTSLAYVFFNQLTDLFFAIGLAVIYVIGFVAIGTISLSKPFDISEGWLKSIMTLFLWAMIEPILLGLVYAIMVPSMASLSHTYGGGMGVKGIAVWYLFTSIVLFVVILLKILAPFLAHMLASNASMGGVLGAGSAIPAAIVMNQILSKLGGAKDGITSKMMPDREGTRTRDGFVQKIGDVMDTKVSDAARKINSGLSGLTKIQ